MDAQLHLGRVLQALPDAGVRLLDDAALVVFQGRVKEVLERSEAVRRYPLATRTSHSGIIAPGFVDLHVHYPQTDVIASPAGGLLPWLEKHTFPHEARFVDPAYARAVAEFFFSELARNGVTTALTFCTSHVSSVDAFFQAAQARGMCMIGGKCLMDRHCPDSLRDDTEQSLLDTEDLIARWHGLGRLGYAITPRFACTSTPAQLYGAGEIASRHPGVWVQSHVSENLDEIAWVRSLYPEARSYLDVYDRAGLLGGRSVYAHCIHFEDEDFSMMRDRGATAAVCPTSNLFLGSGSFDFERAERLGMLHGLASDVGGGMSFSPFATLRAAFTAARSDALAASIGKRGVTLDASRLWWLHTAGAAQCLGLGTQIGTLQVGSYADFIVIDLSATPLLARKTSEASDLESLLFSVLMLGDDRAISASYAAGKRLQTT